jgi:hypothetical protein
MNIFSSDKAPYIFGLLVTVIGWHVTQIGNEVTKTQSVTYRLNVDHRTGGVAVLVRNVSRTRSLVKATFSLDCPGGVDCLAPLREQASGEEAVYAEVLPIAPNNLAPSPAPQQSAASATVVNTVAAGGRYEIVARLAAPPGPRARRNPIVAWLAPADPPVEFFFTPDPERPLDILLYDSRSITGFLVENYFRIVVASLFLFAGLLIFSIGSNLRSLNSADSKGGGTNAG